jgi:hypothetical protein
MSQLHAQSLAAGALAIIGALLVFLGLWPSGRGFSEEMIYLPAVGLAHLAAAVGIFRRRNWGRMLGILVSLVGLVAVLGLGVFVVLLARAERAEVSLGGVLPGVVPLVVYAFVIYALRRRFPDDTRPAASN